MKDRRFQRYIYTGVTAVLVIAVSVLVVFAFIERRALLEFWNKVLEILAPIIYGAVFAFLLTPVYNFVCGAVEKALKGRVRDEKTVRAAGRTAATAASALFLYLIFSGLIRLVIPQLYASIVRIVNTMPTYVQNIQTWITNVFANNPSLEDTILEIYRQSVDAFQTWAGEKLIPNLQNLENLRNLERLFGSLTNGVRSLINLAMNVLIGFIVMVYLLNIKETLAAQMKKATYAFLPLHIANETVEEFRYIHRVFSGFFIGKLIDSLIIGILCFILMKILRLPFELLISVIIGVTNIIPFFGPFIGAVPSAILVFLISPLKCVYFILLILALQQFDGNILGPRILGNSTGLSSFWVLFSILLFGGLFGFVGMIIAVPFTAVVFDVMAKFQYYFLRRKKLSPDTRDYIKLARIDEDNGDYIEHK